MRKLVFFSAVFSVLLLTNSCNNCKNHADVIKKGYANKNAERGFETKYLSVDYIGNCQYRVVNNYFNPARINPNGSSSGDNLNHNIVHICQWKDNRYYPINTGNGDDHLDDVPYTVVISENIISILLFMGTGVIIVFLIILIKKWKNNNSLSKSKLALNNKKKNKP